MQYFRTPEMAKGKGFRCYNCNKLLLVSVKGNLKIELVCPRCKAYILIKLREPIDWERKDGYTEPGIQSSG